MAMRTLLLLRHAKSSWTDARASDHDRPLNARGRKAADRIAAWLARERLLPELALVSSAARTQETWSRMAALWEHAPEVSSLKTLYLAPPSRLLAAIRRAPSTVRRLLILGHNPGLEHLALRLAGPDSDRDALRRLQGKFPTAGLAIFRCDLEDWGELDETLCRLSGFETPRGLEETA